MNNLTVINLGGKLLVNSRDVADMIEKRHDHLLRDIAGYIEILSKSTDPKFGVSDFFLNDVYQDSTRRTLPCYLLTRKGCDMVANKMTGEKGVLFTAAYVTKFEEMEKALAQPQDSYMIEDPIERAKCWIKEAEQKKLLEVTIEQQKPFVLFAESCIASNDSLLVREVAKLANKKGISIGEKRLWQKLREWKVVNSDNEPYQKAMDAGWFEIRQGTYNTPYGSETYRTPKVLPKGQIYIIEKLKKEMQLVTV